MAELTGSEILARSLKNEGTDLLFFLMGGPMLLAESSCIKEGIRPLDVRHEQSAALMGQAYSRLLQKPSVCMAASGPGVINLTTGIANALIGSARQPIILTGSGVIWSQAWDELAELVEQSGIPFYTTPQGRGVLPDDHPYSYLSMRSTAFREADLIIIIGTRMNYIISHAAPPRFNAAAKIARIDIDADEIATAPRKIDIGIVGDCKMVLRQVLSAANGHFDKDRFAAWRKKLADGEAAKRMAPDANQPRDDVPIHPLRLCDEIKNFMKRDAILVVDGQEILNYGRQSMPTYVPGHRLNSGPFGTMGVGLPYGLGAKLAKPDKQVIVVHGDGSFGLNALELDTAVRHNIPILVVISLNGGWTADPAGNKPGRNLGYTRFDKMAETLGCYGDYVEEPAKIRPALDRAQREVDRGNVALVNVKTDHRARAGTLAFAQYST